MTEQSAAPPASAFPWYLAASSLWLGAVSLQGFLMSWLLVGVLETPADQVGFGRALVNVPALVMLVIGGIVADRVDGRGVLLRMHLLIAMPPLLLALAAFGDGLSFGVVIAFGMAMAVLQSLSDPARQAMLNRVSRLDIQRTVTVTTVVTSLVGLAGVWLGGQLDQIGLTGVLVAQALLFAAGALAVRRLPPLPLRGPPPRPDLLGGLKAAWRVPLVRAVIGLDFLSALFNAGAYVIALPFLVRTVYAGGAELFATVMMVFTAGSIGANVVLLRFMPLRRPGRLYLLMQLTRMLILALLVTRPSPWLFLMLILAWGINTGITSTMVRTTVQELAPERCRAQILSLLLLSFMVASPVSAVLLGQVIAQTDPVAALMPGILISAVIFAAGIGVTGLWGFESAAANPALRQSPATGTDRGAGGSR